MPLKGNDFVSVDERSGWQNVRLMKCQVDETSGWQNVAAPILFVWKKNLSHVSDISLFRFCQFLLAQNFVCQTAHTDKQTLSLSLSLSLSPSLFLSVSHTLSLSHTHTYFISHSHLQYYAHELREAGRKKILTTHISNILNIHVYRHTHTHTHTHTYIYTTYIYIYIYIYIYMCVCGFCVCLCMDV
jgi:hypothetical protein